MSWTPCSLRFLAQVATNAGGGFGPQCNLQSSIHRRRWRRQQHLACSGRDPLLRPEHSCRLCRAQHERILSDGCFWLIASALLAGTLAVQPLPRSVLLLDQYGGSLPWVGAPNTAFRTLLNASRTITHAEKFKFMCECGESKLSTVAGKA